MARINIRTEDPVTGATSLGWFDPETSIRYDSGREWNGQNQISIMTGSEWVDEFLYRTKGGRWVLNHDATRYCGGPDSYRFVTDEEAHLWLIRSEINDEAIAEHFGELEAERGPGRPEIGGYAAVRYGAELLARVDEDAKRRGVTRAELLREIVTGAYASAAG